MTAQSKSTKSLFRIAISPPFRHFNKRATMRFPIINVAVTEGCHGLLLSKEGNIDSI
jgi:hypothetical protein